MTNAMQFARLLRGLLGRSAIMLAFVEDIVAAAALSKQTRDSHVIPRQTRDATTVSRCLKRRR